VNVNTKDATSASSIRTVVRNAYSGSAEGDAEITGGSAKAQGEII